MNTLQNYLKVPALSVKRFLYGFVRLVYLNLVNRSIEKIFLKLAWNQDIKGKFGFRALFQLCFKLAF